MTAFVLGVSRIQYLFERRKHSAEARMYLFERRKPSEMYFVKSVFRV